MGTGRDGRQRVADRLTALYTVRGDIVRGGPSPINSLLRTNASLLGLVRSRSHRVGRESKNLSDSARMLISGLIGLTGASADRRRDLFHQSLRSCLGFASLRSECLIRTILLHVYSVRPMRIPAPSRARTCRSSLSGRPGDGSCRSPARAGGRRCSGRPAAQP